MPWLIGIDEAGLGPNLGPLVVTAVVWETPRLPTGVQPWDAFWNAFDAVCSNDPANSDGKLLIADSKLIFDQQRGISSLERSALSMLGMGVDVPRDLAALHDCLGDPWPASPKEPWCGDGSTVLPRAADRQDIYACGQRFRVATETSAWRFCGARALVVQPHAFNAALERFDNKSAAATWVHQRVLQAAISLVGDEAVLILSDKHGGRNRYAPMLSDLFAGAWVETLQEGAVASWYRVGNIELRFEPRSERYAPVALASMISKYIRELHMELFNRYWRQYCPQIKPTAGYPQDARRFFDEIEPWLSRVQIPQDVLWRAR